MLIEDEPSSDFLTADSAAWKPSFECVPSQKGFVSDAQITDMKMIEPFRQFRIDYVQLFSRNTGANSKYRREDQKDCSRCPGLRRAGDWIVHRLIVFHALHSTEQFRQAVVTKIQG